MTAATSIARCWKGIACGTNHIFETYREIGEPPKKLLAVGGGTKNRVWSQATSDISGLPQTVCRKTIGACYGDAFLAALAVGDVTKKDILDWNPEERRIVPDRKNRAVYERQYRMFKELYQRNQGPDGGAVMSEGEGPTCSAWRSTNLARFSGGSTKRRSTPPARCSPAPAGSPVYGCGREALQIKGFAMRLFHLGLPVAVVGDMTTPALGKGDVFLVTSGPGETSTVLTLMQVAQAAGARNLLLTAEPQASAAQLADFTLLIPAQTMASDQGAQATSVLPMGSLFEGALFMLFEIMVLKLKTMLDVAPEAMRARHTNME